MLGPYRKCPGVKRRSGALSIRAFEGSRWHHAAGTLMLWVLNVGEGVEGGVAGLVGSGESDRADWQQGGYGLLRASLGGWNDSFRRPGRRIVRTPKRRWFSSKGLPHQELSRI